MLQSDPTHLGKKKKIVTTRHTGQLGLETLQKRAGVFMIWSRRSETPHGFHCLNRILRKTFSEPIGQSISQPQHISKYLSVSMVLSDFSPQTNIPNIKPIHNKNKDKLLKCKHREICFNERKGHSVTRILQDCPSQEI